MKKLLCNLITVAILIHFTNSVIKAQGVAVSSTGSPPDPSAMLDVSSHNRGVLITRMNTAERDSILSPAEGLQIYNTSTKCFEFYDGSSWLILSCGCTPPAAAGDITGTGTVCQQQTNVTYSVAPIANASGYMWTLPPGASIVSGITNSISVNYSAGASSGNVAVYGTSTSCGNGLPSANFPVTVIPTVPVSVSIDANPSGVICSGNSVTFTATPTNGGSSPSFQWVLNGNYVGSNSSTYSSSSLSDGDNIRCIVTSSASCPTGSPATSNQITMSVTTTVTANVSISANPSGAICSGSSVTFTATPGNGGPGPSYQWVLNGGNVGSNSSTYTNSSLANGDNVSCVMTSNAAVLPARRQHPIN